MWKLDQAEPAWRRRPIDRVPVKVLMSRNLISTYPAASLKDVSKLMLENNVSGLPVVDNGLVGIITKTDIARYFSTLKLDIKTGDIMSDFVVRVHRHHSIHHVIEEMDRNDVHRIMVMEGVTPVGIITLSNLAFTELKNNKGVPPEKDIKMTRKERPGGRKKLRDISIAHLVAEDIMSSPIITIGKETPAIDAAKMMIEHDIDGIPVVDDGKLIGIITKTDILEVLEGLR
jgi:CBS domain-containing protein